MKKGAELSYDKKYRYSLWRIWDESKPLIMYIGLNPSTANANKDDATIRRLIRFSYEFGYGGFYICNLFTFISTHQVDTIYNNHFITEQNDKLLEISNLCKEVVFCWGNYDKTGRSKEVIKLFNNALCFGKNQNGTPKHPVRLAANTKLIPY